MMKIIKTSLFIFALLMVSASCSRKLNDNSNQQEPQISLSDSYKNNFFIGAAISENQILEKDNRSLSIVRNQYNTITPENAMKWMFLQTSPNKFEFDLADKYVEFGLNNNMHIVGHTLVWHSQLADFMNEVTDKTIMSNYVSNHINTIVKRYKGKIDTWDVVNEALNEDGTLRESIFLKTLGENYIIDAFKLAEKGDPNAELAYNDYNLCNPKKREGALRLIENLQKENAKINAVGIQAHWQLNTPSINEIEKSIIAYAGLGVKVMFTELDISVLPNPWEVVGAAVEQNFDKFIGDPKMNPYPERLPDSMLQKQAKRYEDIFELFLKHEDKISRITFWGVTDKTSWLNDWPIKERTNYPLLFDRNYQPKQAYQSILDLKK
ncbi:MAG: endo-1,4-beta-xylanase [Polaribacter sp.]|nr:endo-1,4-beta-xylanase [Polaribacter sp.]MDG1227799.1 endo-1,4-beta-xylanase [Polaribacter sp.]